MDNRTVPTEILAPGYIGIQVAPGTHHAIFTYRPPFYRLPLFLLGILILAFLFYGEWILSHRK